MSTPTRDRRRILGGVVLAVAGAYILFQPFGGAPGTCAGSLSRIVGSIVQGISMCVAASAVPFVVGSSVGLLSIIAALWLLVPGAAVSRAAGLLLVVAVAIVGTGIVAVVTSPTAPFRTFPPAQTAVPIQIPAPTTRP